MHSSCPFVSLAACDTTFCTIESITAKAMFSLDSPRPIKLITSDSANTVHMELIEVPLPFEASSHRSCGVRDNVFAMTSRNRPVPAEHLSFMRKSVTIPFSMRMIFVSCPPMSMRSIFSFL